MSREKFLESLIQVNPDLHKIERFKVTCESGALRTSTLTKALLILSGDKLTPTTFHNGSLTYSAWTLRFNNPKSKDIGAINITQQDLEEDLSIYLTDTLKLLMSKESPLAEYERIWLTQLLIGLTYQASRTLAKIATRAVKDAL